MKRAFSRKVAIALSLLVATVSSVTTLPAKAGDTYGNQRIVVPQYPKVPASDRPTYRENRPSGNMLGPAIGLGITVIQQMSRQPRYQQPDPRYQQPNPRYQRPAYRPAQPAPSKGKRPVRQVRRPAQRPNPYVSLPETLRTARAKPRIYAIGDKPFASETSFVVVLKPGLSLSVAHAFAKDYHLDLIEMSHIKLLDQVTLKLAYPEGIAGRDILEMTTDRRVARAQPNYFYYPMASAQSVAQEPFSELQYALETLGLGELDEGINGEGVRLAVIDSGIRETHPALSGVVTKKFSAFPSELSETVIMDHGTSVASIIAARAGMRGVAQKVSLLSARAFRLNEDGEVVADSFDLARCIDWSVEQGATILNLSFAGSRDQMLEAVLDAAADKGTIAVAAAGNEGGDSPVAFPAAYESVIAVTATDENDALYLFANQGEGIELAAPGVDILVAAGLEGFALQSGTSMATAHVSGAIALLKNKEPDLDVADIKKRLAEAALDLGVKGRDPQFGFGRLDAHKALFAEN
ncbi:S8 family serine peptidase [uncultured Cohaesibacter sp.]|uniref:S8 family peptidase n=1 Tax=uncultured Cohaesibacter sp. TaxID=1002546 RepID=UPI002930B057|nr:S8 family serine peptidase [uncultured Cohaesibacter sp.]